MEKENKEIAEVNQDDKFIGVLCHALGMIVVPLIVYLLKKDDSPYLAAHAKQALIWQGGLSLIFGALTFAIGVIATFTFGLGGLLYFALPPAGLLFYLVSIYAAVKCFQGEEYEYPVLGSLAKSF